jgi:hypothetical protein
VSLFCAQSSGVVHRAAFGRLVSDSVSARKVVSAINVEIQDLERPEGTALEMAMTNAGLYSPDEIRNVKEHRM